MRYILGIDPGISNLGWAVIEFRQLARSRVLEAGVFTPETRRKMTVRETRTGKKKREPIPGSVSAMENDALRCVDIFEELRRIGNGYELDAIAVEDRTIDLSWTLSTMTTQTGVITTAACVARSLGIAFDLIPVKDVHAALGLTIPRGSDAKPVVNEHVRDMLDLSATVDAIRPPSRRVHAVDAIAVVLAASQLVYSRTYQLLRAAGCVT